MTSLKAQITRNALGENIYYQNKCARIYLLDECKRKKDRKKESLVEYCYIFYVWCNRWIAIVEAKEISTMATMRCEISWTIVFLLSFLFLFVFIHSLTYVRTRTFSHILYLPLFSSYFVSPRFCIYDVLKSGYFFSVLFLLTMSAFSSIWMLL